MDYPAVSIGANGPSVTERGPSVRILLESRYTPSPYANDSERVLIRFVVHPTQQRC